MGIKKKSVDMKITTKGCRKYILEKVCIDREKVFFHFSIADVYEVMTRFNLVKYRQMDK